MKWYVIVLRDRSHTPIKRCVTVAEAGDYIYYERKFGDWTVMVQSGTASAPMRELTTLERVELERRLYPSLYE